jgi:hypothetical protein
MLATHFLRFASLVVLRLAIALGRRGWWEGVPIKAHTWGDYAIKHAYQERFRAEQKEYWEKYHAEREARQQQVLDKVAGTFEAVFDVVANMAVRHIENLDSPIKTTRNRAEAALMKMFGSMDAIDRFYLMYLRARGQPEKITKMEHDGQIATTYHPVLFTVPFVNRESIAWFPVFHGVW